MSKAKTKRTGAPALAAVPVQELRDARGRVVEMEPGECIWCGEWVETGRDIAGATRPFDPCWHRLGDFGCNASPESCSEGVGDHARPYDLAIRLLRADAKDGIYGAVGEAKS